MDKKLGTLAALLLASVCVVQPVAAEEVSTEAMSAEEISTEEMMAEIEMLAMEEPRSIEKGLQWRNDVFDSEYQEDYGVEAMVLLYKKCAQAEWDYWKNSESQLSDEMDEGKLAQNNYYLAAVEKQANAFEDLSDIGQAVRIWKEAQLERYRALYYMTLEESVHLDETFLAECREVLGADDEEIVKELQEIIGIGLVDGQFGGGTREQLKEFIAENDINLEFISNLDAVKNVYITRDLVNYIQNLERENDEESDI